MTGPHVTIYSTPTCHYCQMAKKFLAEHGYNTEAGNFVDYDVSTDQEKQKEMIDKSQQMGVPFIVIKKADGTEEGMVGFNEDKLKELLAIA